MTEPDLSLPTIDHDGQTECQVCNAPGDFRGHPCTDCQRNGYTIDTPIPYHLPPDGVELDPGFIPVPVVGPCDTELDAVLERMDHFRKLVHDCRFAATDDERRRMLSQIANHCRRKPYDGYVFELRMEEVFYADEQDREARDHDTDA